MSDDSERRAPPGDGGMENDGWQQVSARLFSREALLSAILVVFLASRFWLMTGFTAMASDTRLYGLLARLGVDCGATPYSDFRIEYPPLAWWLIAAPRLVASEAYPSPKLSPTLEAEYVASYQPTFQCEVLVADVLCLVMTLLVGGLISRRAQLALPAGYTAITLAQPHLLLDRLDVVLLLLVLGWVYCWLRSLDASSAEDRWARVSYLLLGLGVSFKIMPVLFAPFLLLADWRGQKLCNLTGYLGALTLGAVGPFLIQMRTAGWYVFYLFKYHGERSIHIESIWGSLLLLAREFGFPCQVTETHGGVNLVGPLEPKLKIAAVVLTAAAGIGLGGWALAQGRRFDRRTAMDCGYLALINSTVFATVMQPQYLNWLLPIALLLALDDMPKHWVPWSLLVSLMAAILGISGWLFPYHYMDAAGIVALAPLPVALVETRSVCLVAMAVLLNVCFFIAAGSPPPATGTTTATGSGAAV